MPTPKPIQPGTQDASIPKEPMDVQKLKEGLHSKLTGKEGNPNNDNRKLKVQELIKEKIAEKSKGKSDYRTINSYRGIAVNVFAEFTADTLKDLLKGLETDEQEKLLDELAKELGLNDQVEAYTAKNTTTDKKGVETKPAKIKAIADVLAEKYSFMSLSIEGEDNATPTLSKSGEMAPKVSTAITKAADTYSEVFKDEDKEFMVAFESYKNDVKNNPSGRPLYRLDELKTQNPPFDPAKPEDFEAWKTKYNQNLKKLYLVLEDLPFHLSLGNKLAIDIADKVKVKNNGHALPDCEILQGVDLLYRNSKKLRKDTSRTKDDLLFAAETYYWWRTEEGDAKGPGKDKENATEKEKPTENEKPKKAPDTAPVEMAINIVNSFNKGSFNKILGDNNSIGDHIEMIDDDLIIYLDFIDDLPEAEQDDILIQIKLELESVFGEGKCRIEGDKIILVDMNVEEVHVDDSDILQKLKAQGIDSESIDKKSLNELLLVIAQLNSCSTNKLKHIVSANNLVLDCRNTSTINILIKIFDKHGIRFNYQKRGTKLIIVIARFKSRKKDKEVDDATNKDVDDDNDIFGTDGEKYHELLEDGKTQDAEIARARKSRIDGIHSNVKTTLLGKYKPGSLNTPAEKLDALTTAFDTYLADSNKLFKDRQDYRLSKQWGITKGFNKLRQLVSLEPGKARFLSVAGRIGITVGAGMIAGPAAAIGAGFVLSTLAMRRVASKGLLQARTLNKSDASLHNNLAIYHQMNMRKTIDPSASADNTGVFAEHEKNAKNAQNKLKTIVQNKLKQEPHLSVLKSKTTTPEQKIETILKVMDEEQTKLFEAMERERDKLNRIRAAEWLGAAAMAGAIMLATSALVDAITGPPDPIPTPVPPVPIDPPTVPPVPIDPPTVPPVPIDPPTVPPVPIDPTPVPPVVPTVVPPEIVNGVIRVENADYLTTFQQNYNPATALVDRVDPSQLASGLDANSLAGLNVNVDTHGAGNAGNLILRQFQGGDLVDVPGLRLEEGDNLILTGTSKLADVQEGTSNVLTRMQYFEVQNPTTGETGFVAAPFLDRVTPGAGGASGAAAS